MCFKNNFTSVIYRNFSELKFTLRYPELFSSPQNLFRLLSFRKQRARGKSQEAITVLAPRRQWFRRAIKVKCCRAKVAAAVNYSRARVCVYVRGRLRLVGCAIIQSGTHDATFAMLFYAPSVLFCTSEPQPHQIMCPYALCAGQVAH